MNIHKQIRYRRDVRRCGFSLIELIVVMGVSSVLLSLATVTIVRMQALARSDNSRVESLATFIDLGRQFRQDVHRAESVTINNETLTLTSAGQAIHYQRVGDSLSRQVGDAFAVRSPLLGHEPSWQREDAIVRLTLTPTNDDANPRRRFEAAIGLLATDSVTAGEEAQ